MNQRFRAAVAILALLILSLGSTTRAQAPAAPRLNFNGTWKLNIAKSAFDPAPTPSSQTEILNLSGDILSVDYSTKSDDGTQKYIYTLKFGADETPYPKPVVNETPFALVSGKAEWTDNTIVIISKVTYQNSPGTMRSTY